MKLSFVIKCFAFGIAQAISFSLSALPSDLHRLDENKRSFSLNVANTVNEYFKKPYKEAEANSVYFSLRCDNGSIVYRPNHSLAHGMRQAFLAVDIARAFNYAKPNSMDERGEMLATWVKNRFKSDPDFAKKIEAANAFQRTGRESEITRTSDKFAYERYLKTDRANFINDADNFGSLFADEYERNLFANALISRFGLQEEKSDLLFLTKILFSAHLFDLRRIPSFKKGRIQQEIAQQLFEKASLSDINPSERKIIEKIWHRAGDYLTFTGDRDLEYPEKEFQNKRIFCLQAKNPAILVEALHSARNQAFEAIMKSAMNHARVMRELKGAKGSHNALNQDVKRSLIEAPYTASEAFLKIYLEDSYQEIPPQSSLVEQKAILRKNIIAFLNQPKRFLYEEKKNHREFIGMGPRIENPDERYIDILVQALMKERLPENRGKIVLYHTTEPELGFLYDYYSELRNQVRLKGTKKLQTLRAVDTAFLRLDEDKEKKASVKDFMTWFKDFNINDNDPEFQRMGLSTNFALFGSDQQANSDTYSMFFHVKDKVVTLKPPKINNFLSIIEEETGIKSDVSNLKTTLYQFLLNCEGTPCRNGRLLQLFVDPSVSDDVTYTSVLLGYPLTNKSDLSFPSTNELIQKLRMDPMSYKDFVATLGNIHPRKNNQTFLEDLQVRLFMRPEVMFDESLVSINSFWRFPLQDPKEYRRNINAQVDQSLKDWILSGHSSSTAKSAFVDETVNLPRLLKYILKDTFGMDEIPDALPTPKEIELVKLLVNHQDKKAAFLLLKNYEYLKNKHFILSANEYASSGNRILSLEELSLAYYNSPHFIEACFEKSVFPGRKFGVSFYLKLEGYDKYQFLRAVGQEGFDKTLEVFDRYFSVLPEEKLNGYYLLESIRFLHTHGANEELAKEAQRLINSNVTTLYDALRGLAAIEDNGMRIFVTDELLTRKDIRADGLHFYYLIAAVARLQGLPIETRNEIWNVVLNARRPGAVWEPSGQLMALLAALNWKKLERPLENAEWPTGKEVSAFIRAKMDRNYKNILFFSESSSAHYLFQLIADKLRQGFIPDIEGIEGVLDETLLVDSSKEKLERLVADISKIVWNKYSLDL